MACVTVNIDLDISLVHMCADGLEYARSTTTAWQHIYWTFFLVKLTMHALVD